MDLSGLPFSLEDIAKLPASEQREILKMLDQYNEKRSLARARSSFMGYVNRIWPEFIEGRHHREIGGVFDGVRRGELKRVCIHLPPRHALDVNTEIPTPKGFVKIIDLEVGDEVFGPDGKPTKVVGKSEVFKDRPVWLASTDDGAWVRCDDEHLWSVRLDRRYPDRFVERTAHDLVVRERTISENRKPMLPQMAAVEYPEKNLPIPPYTLGVWLGDGTSRQAIITSHDDDQPIVRARIELEGVKTTDQSTRMTFGLLDIKAKLRDNFGMIAGEKYIPRAYLESSVAQRRALLHGLMDTDGNVSKHGQCMFSTSSKAIRDGFLELCHSLGIKASYCSLIPKIGDKEYKRSYRFSFYDADACYLPRKRERCRGYTKKPTGRYLSFKEDGFADTVCIKVDREDGLFMAGRGYIITHNTKSEFASWLLPSNLLGHKPRGKIIQVSNTGELAAGFGRKVRDTMETPEYHEIFNNVTIKADSRSAGRWNTNKGGEYYATGIGGAIAGRGADALIIDDPHTEAEAQSALHNPKIFDDAYEWYVLARQRLQPGGAIIIVMTRWAKRDMAGRVIGKAIEDGSINDWKIVDYPAILPSGNPLWPEFWPLEELLKVKNDIPPSRWLAQYQQRPTNDSGAIIKRETWNPWKGARLPDFMFVINSYDTAYTASTANDFSARTTWGVFWHPDKNGRDIPNVMLIDSWRDRLTYPDLKTHVLQDMKDWTPDTTLIEARGSGRTLVDDLRAAGLFIEEFTPSRGASGVSNDKVARANAVADVFSSGIVWYNTNCPLNETVIEECADLPRGDHDDLADTATQAIKSLRDRMLIGTQHDENPIYRDQEEDRDTPRYRGRIY